MSDTDQCPKPRYVTHLPDLMTAEDYQTAHMEKKVRLRITVTEQGIEILGDSAYPHLLEDLLARIGAEEMEVVLCG